MGNTTVTMKNPRPPATAPEPQFPGDEPMDRMISPGGGPRRPSKEKQAKAQAKSAPAPSVDTEKTEDAKSDGPLSPGMGGKDPFKRQESGKSNYSRGHDPFKRQTSGQSTMSSKTVSSNASEKLRKQISSMDKAKKLAIKNHGKKAMETTI
mmetsp:Transcript_49893/g.93515  ORF Transcript_49893/g.93515 Transcript_49893/m.93515 type:complete len:151 (+) Transcript_49893:90-542(+)